MRICQGYCNDSLSTAIFDEFIESVRTPIGCNQWCVLFKVYLIMMWTHTTDVTLWAPGTEQKEPPIRVRQVLSVDEGPRLGLCGQMATPCTKGARRKFGFCNEKEIWMEHDCSFIYVSHICVLRINDKSGTYAPFVQKLALYAKRHSALNFYSANWFVTGIRRTMCI